MSARLFKRSDSDAIASFAAFTPPSTGGESASHTAPKLSQVATVQPLPSTQPWPNQAADPNSDLVASAQAQAKQIIDNANARAAEIERQARERGAADALASAQRIAEEEIEANLTPLMHRLSETLHEIESLRATVTRRAERDMVLLALEIAKKIVHREVRVDHEIALTLARVALSRVHSRATAKVRLNPDDAEFISSQMDRLESNAAIEIVPDRSVSRGGCLVETEMGDIDARIEKQFAEVEREFLSL